jgi:uncharacterized membrane protein YqiK
MILTTLLFLALLFMVGPLALKPLLHYELHWLGWVVCEFLIGIPLLCVAAYLSAYRKFFVIAEANEAVVRSGGLGQSAGMQVAIGRGIWVIPMMHKSQALRFEQYVLQVHRREKQSLLCKDSLLADVSVTFKITVPKDADSVIKYFSAAGARPLNDPATIETLVGDTLETAIRDAATSSPYSVLFAEREDVGRAIEESLSNDLPKIGLQMTSAKITDVQATDQSYYDPNNPQHAVGLTAIVKITQDQNLATKEKQLTTSESIRAKEVSTQQKILELDQQAAFAKSAQDREIAVRQAVDTRTAQEAGIEQAEALQKRQIEMNKRLAIEQALQERETLEAQVAKDKAVQSAGIAKTVALQTAQKDQEIELVQKEKEKRLAEESQAIEVSKKTAERALAEKARQEAEAEAEKARQSVETVRAVETAERSKRQAIIEQEAASERRMIEKQKEADSEAYKIKKDAEARQLAAAADYEAKVKAAEAVQKSKEAEAAGELAKAMIPVNVKSAEVSVENERVTVLERELAAKTRHGEAALSFELKKLHIQQNAQVRIAMANAMAQLTNNVHANIYGDAETLKSVTTGLANAFGVTTFLQGINDRTPLEIKSLATGSAAQIVEAVSTALAGLGSKNISEKEVVEIVDKAVTEAFRAYK